MMMKESLLLLVSDVPGRGTGLGRGLTNDDEGFFVSADLKCFRNGMWGWGGGLLMMVKDSLFLLVSNVFGMGCGTGEGAQ